MQLLLINILKSIIIIVNIRTVLFIRLIKKYLYNMLTNPVLHIGPTFYGGGGGGISLNLLSANTRL